MHPRLVKILSWHIIKFAFEGGYVTECGRYAPENAETSNDYGHERSCETCLRLVDKGEG